MIKCLSWLLLNLSSLIIFLVSGLALAEPIKVLAVEYPPFTAVHEVGGGISFRYLSRFSQTELGGVPFEPVFVPPARAEALVERGDHCMSFYPPVKDNKSYGFFPLADGQTVKLGLIRKRQSGHFKWNKLSELKGGVLAVLRRSNENTLRQTLAENGIEVVSVETVLQGLLMLEKDRVNFAFGDSSSLEYYATQEGRSFEHLQLSSSYLQEVEVGFYYRIDCTDKIFGDHAERLVGFE